MGYASVRWEKKRKGKCREKSIDLGERTVVPYKETYNSF